MDVSLDVSAGGPTVTGAVLRSNQAYHELLCDKHTLDWGIAFINTRAGDGPMGNHFREVWIQDESQMSDALRAVKDLFDQQDRTCRRWALAESQNIDCVEPVLVANGYKRDDQLAMALASWPSAEANDRVRVLPARPMRAAYETIFHEFWSHQTDAVRDECVTGCLDRLDDHRMDMFVATVDKKPAGVCGLFQVGDIGRIVDLFVCPSFRHQRVATSLMAHVVGLAQRLNLRIVCAQVAAANNTGRQVLAKLGFVEGGRITEFVSPKTTTIDYESW